MSTKKPETFDEVAARLQGHGPASHKDIVYMLLTVKGLREQLRTAEAEFEKLRTKYAILNEVAGVRTQLWNPRAIVQIAAVGSGVPQLGPHPCHLIENGVLGAQLFKLSFGGAQLLA